MLFKSLFLTLIIVKNLHPTRRTPACVSHASRGSIWCSSFKLKDLLVFFCCFIIVIISVIGIIINSRIINFILLFLSSRLFLSLYNLNSAQFISRRTCAGFLREFIKTHSFFSTLIPPLIKKRTVFEIFLSDI